MRRKIVTSAAMLVVGTIAILAQGICGYYDRVSTGTCGGLAGDTGPDDDPPCQRITCPTDWSCPSGYTYLMCDNSPYTASCSVSYGRPVWVWDIILIHVCVDYVHYRDAGSFPCHHGNTLSCNG